MLGVAVLAASAAAAATLKDVAAGRVANMGKLRSLTPSQTGPAVQFTEYGIGDRQVLLLWNRAPSDTLTPLEREEYAGLSFGRYRVWRSETPEDLSSFMLLRDFSIFNEPFDRDNPEVGAWFPFDQPDVADLDRRFFYDPGFVFSQGASLNYFDDFQFIGACCVHNGFNYYYSITYDEAFIDSSTGTARSVFVPRQTIEEGMLRDPDTGAPFAIQPGKPAREEDPLLAEVGVVPNPFNPGAGYGQGRFPESDRIQFINLPGKCTIDIYSAAGDLIRSLDHDGAQDAENWDLRNQNGQAVASGVYIYFVRSGAQETDGRFVIIR